MAANTFLQPRTTITLPSVDSPDFLSKLKALIEIREGHTRDQGQKFVTVDQLTSGDLSGAGSSTRIVINQGGTGSTPSNDSTPPSPPTNLTIENNVISHTLRWTNPTSPDFSHIEIWSADVQDLTQATLVGIATKPTEVYTINGVTPRSNFYYWIRAIDTSGNYSLWTPNNQIGGVLVEGQFAGSINDMLATLLDDTRYATQHTIVADTFKIIQPNAGLTTGKPVFAVGNINGQPSVGIKGDMIVDGTILANALHANCVTADKISAGAVTAGKVAANAINGTNIQAASSIILNEGGKLTVGNNNIILDSVSDSIIIAPDNGTIIGTASLGGKNYCELSQGDIEFFYWNGTTHKSYKSVKRVEAGVGCANNSTITMPGYWKSVPKITVSPHSLQTFNKNYAGYNQKINCEAQAVSLVNGICSFRPLATLVLSDGVILSDPSIYMEQTHDPNEDTWYSFLSGTWWTAPDTTRVYLAGTLSIAERVGGTFSDYNEITLVSHVYIDGVESFAKSAVVTRATGTSIPWSTTINVPQGAHSIFLKMSYYHNDDENSTFYFRNNCTNMVCYQGAFTQVATGTLSYLAVGE